ncbi:hypothetical protein CDD83_5390 [Cordyceps sp. RAO-2017]|nr:hypothetical protein CDD83_5390 [Cordyceps sp. RAO-2017]
MAPWAARGVPTAGRIIAVVLSLAATTVLTLFLTQRVLAIRAWRRLPLVVWLVFAIYSDSYVFVAATALLQHALGVNAGPRTCDSAILLCLVCYVTTKFIYLFLVEKAHIMRPTPKRRLRSKLYALNAFGVLGVYVVVVLLNFIFRIAEMRHGSCVIGMRGLAMVPLIAFDAVVNVYLTIMFLIPLRKLYSFQHLPRSPATLRLRSVAFRTFCGAVCTLLSSILYPPFSLPTWRSASSARSSAHARDRNLGVLMALDGEPGWVCLMCCNSDILFSAIVIQWVTSKDHAGSSSTPSSSRGAGGGSGARPRAVVVTTTVSTETAAGDGRGHGSRTTVVAGADGDGDACLAV